MNVKYIGGLSRKDTWSISIMYECDLTLGNLYMAIPFTYHLYRLLDEKGGFIAYVGRTDIEKCFRSVREVNLDILLS
jgi:ABC-type uncharacterized transport system involved in gliding motility auxiliary subunit